MLEMLRIAVVCAVSLLASGVAAQEPVELRFSLDWKFEGPSAPFFVAIDQGYFAEEGLEVTIDTGAGSRESIPRVATGAYEMGFGDINALTLFLAENPGAAVKGVFMMYDKPPFAVVGRRSLGVTEDPRSLEGKKLGAPPPDAAFGQWPAFSDVNGLDTDTITIESVGFPVREPMLAQGQVDAIFGFSFSSVINLKAQGVEDDDIVTILMADNGLALYGNAVMVNTEWAAANPDAVRGFLRALVRGVQFTANDPDAAIEAVMARNDVADGAVELERLKMALADNILTAAAREDGVGRVRPERMAQAIGQLQTSFEMPIPPAPEVIFTEEYLPDAAASKF